MNAACPYRKTGEGADIADIVALNRVVQSFHAAADPEFFRVDTEEVELQAFFGTLVSSEESVIFLAECEGRAAGYVWFEIQDRAELFTRPMKRMNVHHLVVSEDTRRRGVGSALMDAAKARAVSRDVRYHRKYLVLQRQRSGFLPHGRLRALQHRDAQALRAGPCL